VEGNRQRLAHVGHHREVQQLGDVHLVFEPTPVDPVVFGADLRQLTPGSHLVDLAAPGRLGHRDLGLLLDTVALESALGAPLVGRGDGPDPAADHPAQREDQPPKVSGEVQHRVHSVQNAIATREGSCRYRYALRSIVAPAPNCRALARARQHVRS
jgi:hypothetical protein